jgi:hypothetical protein
MQSYLTTGDSKNRNKCSDFGRVFDYTESSSQAGLGVETPHPQLLSTDELEKGEGWRVRVLLTTDDCRLIAAESSRVIANLSLIAATNPLGGGKQKGDSHGCLKGMC